MAAFILSSLLYGLAAVPSSHAFQLHPLIPPAAMSEMLGISPGCVAALNETLPCDNDIFQWTQKVDQVRFEQNDVVALCTSDCIASTERWNLKVQAACENDYLRSGDRFVPADTLSGRYSEGLQMACMRSSSNEWCLIDSYEWVGSDVVQVDCEEKPEDPWCLDPANSSPENSRMSTLYDDDLLCSECFLKTLHARVTSEFLDDTEFSEYLVAEFQDIQDVCQTTVGELVTRIAPDYPRLTDAADLGLPVITSVSTTSEAAPSPTACAGREIDIKADREEELGCHDIAEKYRVASGEMGAVTGNELCDTEGPICISEECLLYQVNFNETCNSIAAALTVERATNVSLAQLATWNPYILGACDKLFSGQFICAGPPGGGYELPPASEIPDDSEGPIRGGPGSTPTLPIVDDPQLVSPDLVQEGMPKDCVRWIQANSTSAGCWKLANDAKITQPRLWELNPVLGKLGEDCTTQVWLNYYYCVAREGDGDTITTRPPTSTTTTSRATSTSTTGVPKPTNTQDGIAANCNKFHEAKSGDGCWSAANDNGITQEQLYKWNPVLGSNGENCGTQFWLGYFYCVGVSG